MQVLHIRPNTLFTGLATINAQQLFYKDQSNDLL